MYIQLQKFWRVFREDRTVSALFFQPKMTATCVYHRFTRHVRLGYPNVLACPGGGTFDIRILQR
jgi:hypothetical protein